MEFFIRQGASQPILKMRLQTTDEYYITHQFTESQTARIGKYEGKVTVQFLDTNLNPTTKLILPVKEKLFITIF